MSSVMRKPAFCRLINAFFMPRLSKSKICFVQLDCAYLVRTLNRFSHDEPHLTVEIKVCVDMNLPQARMRYLRGI